jgi:D-glycero-D-manno-heptose 1,7-bisphosphate phosphatase
VTRPRAVFLDRDGVLNHLVLNAATGEYESPLRAEQLELLPNVIAPLSRLGRGGYLLFLVSNQPSFAKGKTTLNDLKEAHRKLEEGLIEAGVRFSGFYYCFHHPSGVVAGYSGPCACRKPSPHFLLAAAAEHGLDLESSWMVGDQDSDVACANAARCQPVLLEYEFSANKRGSGPPVTKVRDLAEAVELILETARSRRTNDDC